MRKSLVVLAAVVGARLLWAVRADVREMAKPDDNDEWTHRREGRR